MCARVSKNENTVLIFSALLASAFAVSGIVFGLMLGSLVMVFDGFYSSVSLLLTLLSLAVSRYISKPSKGTFPFGKAILEPLVINIKAAVIIAVVGYSLYSAILALLSGGREVDASSATLFGALSTIGCGYAWWYITRKSKRFSSGLIEAEAKQWQMDTLLSVAVTLGFLSAWLVSLSPYADYAVYADPVMMCLMSAYFIKVPFDMLKEAMRELLMMSPSQDIRRKVNESVLAVDEITHQNLALAGVTKTGRELRVDVDIKTSNSDFIAVADIESTRRSLTRRLSVLPFDLQLNLSIAR